MSALPAAGVVVLKKVTIAVIHSLAAKQASSTNQGSCCLWSYGGIFYVVFSDGRLLIICIFDGIFLGN